MHGVDTRGRMRDRDPRRVDLSIVGGPGDVVVEWVGLIDPVRRDVPVAPRWIVPEHRRQQRALFESLECGAATV